MPLTSLVIFKIALAYHKTASFCWRGRGLMVMALGWGLRVQNPAGTSGQSFCIKKSYKYSQSD